VGFTSQVRPDLIAYLVKLSVGKRSLGAEDRSSHGTPPVDLLPGHQLDVSVHQTLDAVVDPERIVAGDDAVPNKRSKNERPDRFFFELKLGPRGGVT
jgi:hypothetical protein